MSTVMKTKKPQIPFKANKIASAPKQEVKPKKLYAFRLLVGIHYEANEKGQLVRYSATRRGPGVPENVLGPDVIVTTENLYKKYATKNRETGEVFPPLAKFRRIPIPKNWKQGEPDQSMLDVQQEVQIEDESQKPQSQSVGIDVTGRWDDAVELFLKVYKDSLTKRYSIYSQSGQLLTNKPLVRSKVQEFLDDFVSEDSGTTEQELDEED
jgi:hypothetical protein